MYGPQQPLWLPEDTEAALEYAAYLKTLCPGHCGQPKHESFDPATDDRYDVAVLQCHACAARDRRAWIRNSDRSEGQPPSFGEFYIVTPEEEGR